MAVAHSRLDAEVEQIVRTLRSYGVLTRHQLREQALADRWRGDSPAFGEAVRRAQRAGRVRRLRGGLYELTESERFRAA